MLCKQNQISLNLLEHFVIDFNWKKNHSTLVRWWMHFEYVWVCVCVFGCVLSQRSPWIHQQLLLRKQINQYKVNMMKINNDEKPLGYWYRFGVRFIYLFVNEVKSIFCERLKIGDERASERGRERKIESGIRWCVPFNSFPFVLYCVCICFCALCIYCWIEQLKTYLMFRFSMRTM